MKNIYKTWLTKAVALAVSGAALLGLTACSTQEAKTVKVAAHTSPMLDMLEMIKADVEKDGYKLEIVTVSDNVQANTALQAKDVDANFFQHSLFMQEFNEKNNASLTVVSPIYDALVAFYSKSIAKLSELEDGAKIAVPADSSNLTRALRLLAQADLIKLKDPASFKQTLDTIENPHNFEFKTVSLLNLNEAYNEVDLCFNYPAYAAKIDLTPLENGVLLEDEDPEFKFAISLVAREDNKDSAGVTAVLKHLRSQKIADFINKELAGKARVAFKL